MAAATSSAVAHQHQSGTVTVVLKPCDVKGLGLLGLKDPHGRNSHGLYVGGGAAKRLSVHQSKCGHIVKLEEDTN